MLCNIYDKIVFFLHSIRLIIEQSCENNNYGRLIIILIEQRSIIWNKNKNIRAKIKIIESIKKKTAFRLD